MKKSLTAPAFSNSELDQLLPLWSFATHQKFMRSLFERWEIYSKNATVRHCKVTASFAVLSTKQEHITAKELQAESGETALNVHRSLQRGVKNGQIMETPGADNRTHLYRLTDEGVKNIKRNWQFEVTKILDLQRIEADNAFHHKLIQEDEHAALIALTETHKKNVNR